MEVSQLQIDLLVLFYSLSDQYGNVDMETAGIYARHQLGLNLSNKPYRLNQAQLDFLMRNQIVPDTRLMLNEIFHK